MNRTMTITVILMIIIFIICIIKLIIIGVSTPRNTTVPSVTQSIHSTYKNYKNTPKPKTSVKIKSRVKSIRK